MRSLWDLFKFFLESWGSQKVGQRDFCFTTLLLQFLIHRTPESRTRKTRSGLCRVVDAGWSSELTGPALPAPVNLDTRPNMASF